jgi:polyamine oxidase
MSAQNMSRTIVPLLLLVACGPRVKDGDRVLVVGAGASGLAAARVLADNDLDVVVLEARDRIGGRTWTADVGRGRADLGAAWLHGIVDNPVADFMDAQGLGFVPDELPWAVLFDAASGSALGDDAWSGMDEAVEGFEASVSDLADTLGDVDAATARDTWLDDEGLTRQERRLARHAITQWTGELEYAGPFDRTGLANYEVEAELAGGDHFPVGGYAGLVEALAEGIDIRLSHPVTEIWQGEEGVEVTTAGGEVVEGAHVIVTVPAGVLRAGSIAFDPPLSDLRRGALERLDTGNLEKVALAWDAAWWEGSIEYVDADGAGAFPEFFDLAPLAGAPVIVGLYGGRFARDLQGDWTDAEIVQGALDVLAEATGRTVPPPTATLVTHWTTDPYARGSYVYLPPGATTDDLDLLAAPEGARVRFAGEATVSDMYGNVHAAVLSGLREAEALGADPGEVGGWSGW